MSKGIPVVFVSDDNYAMPTAVAIYSLKKNKDRESSYDIFVLSDSISRSNKEKLSKMTEGSFSVKIIDMDSNYYTSIGFGSVPKSIHVSKAALFKFQIAEIFKEYKKILYLDGDIIIQRDLSELYDTDIDGYYVAAVDDMKAMISYQPSQNIKLGVNHVHYFNSGVMLFNLELMRANNISKKLLDYRTNGLNFFMDQDAFNVVFEDKVHPLEFKYNVIYSNYSYYPVKDLKNFYKLTEKDKKDIIKNAVILHLSSKEKPWLYSDMEFSGMWDTYHQESPFACELQRKTTIAPNVDSLKSENEQLKKELKKIKNSVSYKIGTTITAIPRKIIAQRKDNKRLKPAYPKEGLYSGPTRDKKIIVSLTSYPARDHILPKVIESLLKQTVKADKIIVYLSSEQYPHKKLNRDISKSRNYGVEIVFVEGDLKPHKKYYYSMQDYPNDIIITVDDDVYYHPKLIERLYKSYLSHPNCVSASRVHKIRIDEHGNVAPYNLWEKNYTQRLGAESMKLIATGVGGVLYPPRSIPKEAFDKDAICETCLYADDLWLKVMEVANNVKVVLASKDNDIQPIVGSQESALWINNVDGNENDKQLVKILNYFEERKSLIVRRIAEDCKAEIIDCDALNYVSQKMPALQSIDNLNTYLKTLELIARSCVIIVTTTDTVSRNWKEIRFPAFIGKVDDPGYRRALSMIIDHQQSKKLIKYGEKYSRIDYNFDNKSILAISYGYDKNNRSYVIINDGRKMAYYNDDKKSRGLYIVVYSRVHNAVIDYVKVDPHIDRNLKLIHL